MVGWHHQLNGHEYEQTLGDNEGQRSLVCRSPLGHKELDMTEQLNNKAAPIILHLANLNFQRNPPLLNPC